MFDGDDHLLGQIEFSISLPSLVRSYSLPFFSLGVRQTAIFILDNSFKVVLTCVGYMPVFSEMLLGVNAFSFKACNTFFR